MKKEEPQKKRKVDVAALAKLSRVTMGDIQRFSMQLALEQRNKARLVEEHAALIAKYPDSLTFDDGWCAEEEPPERAWHFVRLTHCDELQWALGMEETYYYNNDTLCVVEYERSDARYNYTIKLFLFSLFVLSAQERRPQRLLLCAKWCAEFHIKPLMQQCNDNDDDDDNK